MSKSIDINLGGGRSDKLPIKAFTLKMFVEHPAIIMIAKRGSGKSWVVRAILRHFNDIPIGMIISPTDKMSSFYGDFFPDTYIFYKYESKIIENVMKRQSLMIDKEKSKKAIGKKVDPRCFIVMDDCLGDKKSWAKDPPIQELLFNGRHYKIMYILTMQYPLGITPDLRSNFDYIFLLKEDFISNLKRMYDHYAGMFPNFDSFRQVFGQLTDNFGSMVIVNRGAGASLFEKIYYYKAPNDSTQIEFGCKQFRDYHANNYDENWRIKGKQQTVDDYLDKKKKAKSRIVVDKLDSVSKIEGDISFGKKKAKAKK